jgi:hypothetical protein
VSPDWWVAAGTLALAATTGVLAFVTWRMAKSARDEVAIERERIDAATRPVVYPLALYDWVVGRQGSGYDARRLSVLPLKNGGAGPALNVHGAIFLVPDAAEAAGQVSLELQGGSIAAGDVIDARLEHGIADWSGVVGFIVYKDLADDEWVTHFRFGLGRVVTLSASTKPPAASPKPVTHASDTAPLRRS